MNGENVNSAVWHISSFLSFNTNQIYFQSSRTATETPTSWTAPSRTPLWTTTTLRTMQWRSPRETSWRDTKVSPLRGVGRVRTRDRPWPPRTATWGTWPSSRASPAPTRRRRTRDAASQWRSSELDVTRDNGLLSMHYSGAKWSLIGGFFLSWGVSRIKASLAQTTFSNHSFMAVSQKVKMSISLCEQLLANNKIWPTCPVPAPSQDNLPGNNFERNWQH